MAHDSIPMQVLSEQMKEAIAGRRVRSAVFTTFSFDPGFFEVNVLPILFDQPFSQPDKVRRLQLEDALRAVDHIAVYYDRRALAQDAEPAQLDYRRIDVSRETGYFHPKVTLLLLEEPPDENDGVAAEVGGSGARQALLVLLASANLTRAGWWENVECAHLEEIKDREVEDRRCSYRHDLLALIRRLRETAQPDDDHRALDRISDFLLKRTRTDRFVTVSSSGHYYTRIFCGQNRHSLAHWLRELRLERQAWNFEVIAPYFDDTGAGPLPDLIEALTPRETRVWLPQDADGSALVTQATYDAIPECQDTTWAVLPKEVLRRGRSEGSERLAPRRVHAKVYRLWRKGGRDLLIVGSPNLTESALSHGAAGNLEAAFFVDVTDAGFPRRWWLDPLNQPVERFASEHSAEEDGHDVVALDLSFRYDWASDELSYRLADAGVRSFDVSTSAGTHLARIDRPRTGRWVTCPPDTTAQVRELLRSTSFLAVSHEEKSWRVLVREENMGHRPSLLMQLTPEEILEYWSLLTPQQRAHFLESRILDDLEGLAVTRPERLHSTGTLFDRFSGVYHAFGCLLRSVETALEEGREREAETRVLGAKYDSLPSLLEKSLAQADGDRIMRYVTFLCAQQARDELLSRHRAFFRAHPARTDHLDHLISRLPDVRRDVGVGMDGHDRAFLDWYERAFLQRVGPGRGSS